MTDKTECCCCGDHFPLRKMWSVGAVEDTEFACDLCFRLEFAADEGEFAYAPDPGRERFDCTR
jgi:hypothetical protein